MSRRVTYEATALAAMVALVCGVVEALTFNVPGTSIGVQPSLPVGTLEQFLLPINEYRHHA